ncbi:MAG: biliverdin-producing heme oxygenase [Telmatospirillum sp.]|nr:biliverdin-producing heme oxygenase [Telmatospirillum sp.]
MIQAVRATDDDCLAPIACREALRLATQEPHARLHRHTGFAAVADGTIDMPAYRMMLVRLYGFYRPFERALAAAPMRTQWLAADLVWCGVDVSAHARIPECRTMPPLPSRATQLGARYVVEGSALGGRQLARGLDRLLGRDCADGRRFFAGRGADTGHAWANFTAELAAHDAESAARTNLVAAAVATFAAFETWLADWSDAA